MGPSSHLRKFCYVATILVLLGPTLSSGGLVNLGMVSLKGSLGIGLRPSPGKGEPSGPLLSTYYGHGLGPGGNSHASGTGSVSSSPQNKGHNSGRAGSPNFVTSCCKGKLKLFGQNIFGHGHFKGQYVKGPSPTVTNYHHLHNNGQETPGTVGVVSINEIHEDHHDHPVKFKNYESYKHRQYPKQEGYPFKDEGSYPQKYNYKKFKTPPPVQQGFQDHHDSPTPFWENGNKGPSPPLVIDGGQQNHQNHHSDDGDNFHHHNQENDHGPPPSNPHISDTYPKDGPGPSSHYQDNHHQKEGYASRYPPPRPGHNNEPNNAFHDYSETDGVYHSHPNSPSSSFSNSIYEDDKPGGYPSSSGYRTSKGFVNSPYYPPGVGVGSAPIQVVDHHHPPGSEPFSDHQGSPFGNHIKEPTFPSYPPPPTQRRSVRNGFTTPKFRPIPRSSLIPTQPMIPMSDSSSWMPFKGLLGQKDRDFTPEPKTSSNDKDLKYRVYEYGKNEVIVIDGGLKPHEKDLLRAHVYSKDEGKLLRTIEIKDAIGGGNGKIEANRRSDTVTSEEENGKSMQMSKSRISFVTDKPSSTTLSTPSTTVSTSSITTQGPVDDTLVSSTTLIPTLSVL